MYECEDSSKKNANSLILKVNKNINEITEEIRTLKNVRKSQKMLYGDKCSLYTPVCTNFGMLVLQEHSDDDAELVGYLVMKRYSMNLESYIISKPTLSITEIMTISKSILIAF